jgi:hypothetical protein
VASPSISVQIVNHAAAPPVVAVGQASPYRSVLEEFRSVDVWMDCPSGGYPGLMNYARFLGGGRNRIRQMQAYRGKIQNAEKSVRLWSDSVCNLRHYFVCLSNLSRGGGAQP